MTRKLLVVLLLLPFLALGAGTAALIVTDGSLTGNGSTAAPLKLTNTGVTAGSYTLTNATVDAQGRVTAASSYSGTTAPADKAITALSAAGAGTFAYFYDSPGTGLATGATGNIVKLADTAVSPGSYTYASVTVDQQGRVTAASSGSAPVTSGGALTSGVVPVATGPSTLGNSDVTDNTVTHAVAVTGGSSLNVGSVALTSGASFGVSNFSGAAQTFSSWFSAAPDSVGNIGQWMNMNCTGSPIALSWSVNGTPKWAGPAIDYLCADFIMAFSGVAVPTKYDTADLMRIGQSDRRFMFGPEVAAPTSTDGQYNFSVPPNSWVPAGIQLSNFSNAHFSSSVQNDFIRFNRNADADKQWLTWHQGGGTQDWRMGMEKDSSSYDFNVYASNGASTTPNSPGTLAFQITPAGNVTTAGSVTIQSGNSLTLNNASNSASASLNFDGSTSMLTTASNVSLAGGVYMTGGNGYNCQYSTNGTATCYLDYFGYAAGTTQFRDLFVGDGKGNQVVYVTGSTKAVEFNGPATLDSTLNVLGITTLQNAGSTTRLDIKNTGVGGRDWLIDSNATAGGAPNALSVFDNTGSTYRLKLGATSATINNASTDTLTLHGATAMDSTLSIASTNNALNFDAVNGTSYAGLTSSGVLNHNGTNTDLASYSNAAGTDVRIYSSPTGGGTPTIGLDIGPAQVTLGKTGGTAGTTIQAGGAGGQLLFKSLWGTTFDSTETYFEIYDGALNATHNGPGIAFYLNGAAIVGGLIKVDQQSTGADPGVDMVLGAHASGASNVTENLRLLGAGGIQVTGTTTLGGATTINDQGDFGHASAVSYTGLANRGVINYDTTNHTLVLAAQYSSGVPHILLATSNSGNAATQVDISNSNVTVTPDATLSARLNVKHSTASLLADQTAWSIGAVNVLEITNTSSANRTIKGIDATGAVEGTTLTVICNTGVANALFFTNEDASATAANRITAMNGQQQEVDCSGGSTGVGSISFVYNGSRWLQTGISSLYASSVYDNGSLNVVGVSTLTTTNTGNLTSSGSVAAGTNKWSVDINGHMHATGTAPTLSSCGTSPTVTGSDVGFRVHTGTSGTTCTITFASAYTTNAPSCRVWTEGSTTFPTCTVSTTAITCTTTVASTNYDWSCVAPN